MEIRYRKQAMAVLFCTVLMNATGFGIIIPVMPQLIMEVSAGGLTSAAFYNGWLMFAYAVMQFVFAPVIGNLSDRYGRRVVILVSLAVFSVDFFIMAWAPTLYWLFVGRVFAGMAASTQGAANAYIADIIEPDERAGRYGMLGAAFGIGFLVGPVIGGLLGEYGSRVPFLGGAVLGLINFLLALFFLRESLPVSKRRPLDLKGANPFSAFQRVTKNPVFFWLLPVLFLYVLAHFVFPATWSYYTIVRFSWSPAEIGYSLGFVGILMVLVQGLLTKRAVSRIGAYYVCLIGLVVSLFSYIGYGLLPEGWMMYLVMLPGALSGFTMPAMQQLMTSSVREDRQGELQGLITSLYSLTAILGPLIMTWLFSRFSDTTSGFYFPGMAFIFAAVLTSLSLLLLLWFRIFSKGRNLGKDDSAVNG
ncbi:MAG: TCR/Tet family MFS transporter [Gammaproteobacteria bacterium]|nr:TCR/Tet family MFS transporter [Gammaproteobacteria bacterium]